MNKVPRWVFRYVGNKTFDFSSKKKDFCPKTTKFGPKLAFLVNLGQAMQAYSVPCWWLWRAGCISQDTYSLYPDCCHDCRILHHPAHLVCQFSALFASQGLTSLCDALLKQKEYPVIQIDFPTAMSDMAEVSLNSK